MRVSGSEHDDGYQYVRRYCHACDVERLCFPIPSKHRGCFLLTAFTLGLWAPVWAAMALYHRARPYRCMSCGRRTSGRGAPADESRIIRMPRKD